MRRHAFPVVLVVALVAAFAGPARAHHSFFAEYDAKAWVSVTGVVTQVEWVNPHTYVHVDVTGQRGKVAHWVFEGYSPNRLEHIGFPRTLVKPGEVIHITGYRAWKDHTRAAGREITLADGRTVSFGPPA